MRHLHRHPLQEARQPAPQAPAMGWVLSGSHYLWAGAAPTFWRFTELFVQDSIDGLPDERIYDLVGLERWVDAQEWDMFSSGDGADLVLWWGLQPRAGGEWFESGSFPNPYKGVQWLEELFVNPGPRMTRAQHGCRNDVRYLAASLEAEPSAGTWFRDYDEQPAQDHKLKAVLAAVKSRQEDIRAMMQYGTYGDLI